MSSISNYYCTTLVNDEIRNAVASSGARPNHNRGASHIINPSTPRYSHPSKLVRRRYSRAVQIEMVSLSLLKYNLLGQHSRERFVPAIHTKPPLFQQLHPIFDPVEDVSKQQLAQEKYSHSRRLIRRRFNGSLSAETCYSELAGWGGLPDRPGQQFVPCHVASRMSARPDIRRHVSPRQAIRRHCNGFWAVSCW